MRIKFWGQNKIYSNEKTLWQTLNKEEKEREYSPSSIIGGNYKEFVKKYDESSQLVRKKIKSFKYNYGKRNSNVIEFAFTDSRKNNPLIIFFHGGYWQELSIKESFFSAVGSIENNISFASINYSLAPEESISGIVDECINSVDWVIKNDDFLGINSEKIIISGSSAGAHLAAMVILKNKFKKTKICGSILVSGIYELEPLIGTSINNALKLNKNEAKQNSPIYKDLNNFPPTLIVYGENETLEFKRQSNAFANKLFDSLCKIKIIEINKRNHFDVILELTDKKTPLGKEVFKFFDLLGINDAKI